MEAKKRDIIIKQSYDFQQFRNKIAKQQHDQEQNAIN